MNIFSYVGYIYMWDIYIYILFIYMCIIYKYIILYNIALYTSNSQSSSHYRYYANYIVVNNVNMSKGHLQVVWWEKELSVFLHWLFHSSWNCPLLSKHKQKRTTHHRKEKKLHNHIRKCSQKLICVPSNVNIKPSKTLNMQIEKLRMTPEWSHGKTKKKLFFKKYWI